MHENALSELESTAHVLHRAGPADSGVGRVGGGDIELAMLC